MKEVKFNVRFDLGEQVHLVSENENCVIIGYQISVEEDESDKIDYLLRGESGQNFVVKSHENMSEMY